MKLIDFDCVSLTNEKIVIYGTTVGGKLIFQCLQSSGLDVDFFCDRSKKYSEFCGVPVKDPVALQNNTQYKVLIALTRSFDSACQFLEKIGYNEAYCCKNLIKDKKIENFSYAENEKELVQDFLEKYPIYAASNIEKDIILPSLEVFITERCTLRCRDCSHLIPRYQHPRDYDIDQIINTLENTLKVVTKIPDLIILGGEPMLHKELYKLLYWGSEQNAIGTLTIISNGSVMPDERVLTAIKETNTRIRLSNYGKYSVKINELVKILKKREISYYINDELWTDMGEIVCHSYSKGELKEIFTDCPFAYDYLLLKGRIFRCAHVAHLNNLGVIDSYMHDSVELTEVEDETVEDKRKELQEYMHVDYLEGCIYCNGVKNSIQGIEPAIQGVR